MEIYLIRHTTPDIENGICYGQSDLSLITDYKNEFKSIIAQIPNPKNFKVISSPLKRCTLLAKQFNEDVIFDSRLMELSFGDWELKAWHDIPQEDINPWMKDFVNTTIPNGESYTQLASRVSTFFKDTINSKDNQNLIIITHAGPIRAFLSNLLNIALKDSFSIKINYGDVFHLRRENKSIKLITEINL